jgi:hypothetical protein
MDTKITDLPLKTTTLAGTDLLEVAEDQGGGIFVSKKIPGTLIPSGGSQNTFETITATTGSTTANSPTDTLNIVGSGGVSTAISGDTLTITGPGSGFSQFSYEIGQYVASEGGVIAYRWLSNVANGAPTSGTVQNYLVVNLSDVSTSAGWGYASGLVGASSFNNGQSNTSLIAPISAAGTAAVLCDSLVSGGKSDWYLPAADEWIIIFQNRWEINQGLSSYGTEIGFSLYWTSTEGSGSNAVYFSAITGNTQGAPKSNTLSIRALRRFSI